MVAHAQRVENSNARLLARLWDLPLDQPDYEVMRKDKVAELAATAGVYEDIIRRSSALGLQPIEVVAQGDCCCCFSLCDFAVQSEFFNDELVAPEACAMQMPCGQKLRKAGGAAVTAMCSSALGLQCWFGHARDGTNRSCKTCKRSGCSKACRSS